jgi:hypothetical protein
MRNRGGRKRDSRRLMSRIGERNRGGREMRSIGDRKMRNRNCGKKK